MIMDKSHRRFFVADSIGTIHIFTPEVRKFNFIGKTMFNRRK